ncbi:hypothetical protein HDU91_003042, partial [Kappamyces sp. JEL0680]
MFSFVSQGLLCVYAVQAASFSVTVGADYKFSPATLNIRVNDTVTWNFHGTVPHNVVGVRDAATCTPPANALTSGAPRVGGSWVYTFNRGTGSFYYVSTQGDDCSRRGMRGVVNVLAASAAPSAVPSATMSSLAPSPSLLPNDITLVAKSSNLTVFLDDLNSTSLISTFQGLQNYTFFAPRNSAFLNLTAKPSDQSHPMSTPDLASVLKLHAVSGVFLSRDLANETTLVSMGRGRISLSTVNGTTTLSGEGNVNGTHARIVQANIKVAQGIMHILDTVLVPV